MLPEEDAVLDPAAVLAEARADLVGLPNILDALLGGLDADGWNQRPATDEWSPIEIVCHLRDEETEDFGARLRAVLDGGSRFAPNDPERWPLERRYREDMPALVMRDLRERRAASLALLDSIGTTPERLLASTERPSPEAGSLSGLDLIVAWVTHDRLHLAQLAGTLARVGQIRWQPLRADYGGPIPYPTPLSDRS